MSESNKLPPDFLKLMEQALSKDEVSKFIDSLDKPPTTSIRLNPEKHFSHSPTNKIPWCEDGYYLDRRPSFTLDPLFHAGAYYVQEASSMFIEQFIKNYFAESSKIKALDLCAAPGGKSTHLLSLLNNSSLLVSNEVIRSRASILIENIQKWGKANVVVTQNDPTSFTLLKGFFDLIVVDAPCSGEGLFRKDAEAINEWSVKGVQLCSQRQKRILSDIFPSLSQNGLMIYCTCTYNSIENEENLRWLQDQYDIEFVKIPNANLWGIEEVSDRRIIGYRFMPHRTLGEGFFISGFIKRAQEQASSFKIKHDSKFNFKPPDVIGDWLKSNDNLQYLSSNNSIRFFPKLLENDIHILIQTLNCIQVGTVAGTVKHKFIPEHSFALSNELNKDACQLIELSKEEAIQYLKKEPIRPNGPNGYTLVTHMGIALGWVNQLDTRSNNLYPTNWRIKMKSK